jgi:hypothetical protein
MIRAAAIGVALAGLASPALATEWLNCGDAAGEASFGILLGSMDVISISATTMSVGEKVWASDVSYGPGDPISIGQAFEDDDTIIVDAVNEGAVIGRLRLFKTSEGTGEIVYGGTLHIPGYGAWAVSCSG